MTDQQVIIPKENYPSNSNKSKVQKVTSGTVKVKTKKNSIGKTISESFFSSDAADVGTYVVNEILVPVAKTTLSEIVTSIFDVFRSSVDAMLYGDDAPRISRARRNTGTVVNYGRYSSSYNRRDDERRQQRYFRENTTRQTPVVRSELHRSRGRSILKEVYLETRSDAQEVLTNLEALIEAYGVATIADYYDLVGVDTSFVDYKHGWEDLGDTAITRLFEGYLLSLPQPIQL